MIPCRRCPAGAPPFAGERELYHHQLTEHGQSDDAPYELRGLLGSGRPVTYHRTPRIDPNVRPPSRWRLRWVRLKRRLSNVF